MKKTIAYILWLAGILAVSCKPDAYTGPLDSPVGNWEGIRSQYLFNGEQVADLDSCETAAISFYKQGLCCIEGVKGAFPYTYDHQSGSLQIDSSRWQVLTLTGAEVVMQYLYTTFPPAGDLGGIAEGGPEDIPEGDPGETPEDSETKPDANGVVLPAEYNGFTITSDANGYFYTNEAGKTVYCRFKGTLNESGALVIDFWFDSHIDHLVPLVVTETKK